MTRGVKALAAVAVVTALVVACVALAVRSLDGDDAPRTTTATSSARPVSGTAPAAPAETPPEGLLVTSDVTADGRVEVETWLRSSVPVGELTLSTTDPELVAGTVESLDVVVRSEDGRVLAQRDSIGSDVQILRLRRPVTELYLSYTVDGAMDDASQTVEGRRLARVLGMDVDYDGADEAAALVRHLVTGPGTVLNVACLTPPEDPDDPRSGPGPRPCGRATGDGGWVVDLAGAERHDRLLAQLED